LAGTSEEGGPEDAILCYKAAWRRFDNTHAAYRLGCAYYLGRGVTRDLEAAKSHLGIAALDDWRYAQHYLGLVYASPDSRFHNIELAKKHLTRAAEAGVTASADELLRLG
jgi:TPR repeat protein